MKNIDIIKYLDKDKYKLDTVNYYLTKAKKSQILLGSSLRKDSNNIIHLKHKDFGNSKKWPTYTITREGLIYQHFDPTYYTDYLGIKDVDRKSISIELENMGMLHYNSNKECFVNWVDEVCDDSLVYDKLWKNYRYWESYTQKQYLSLSSLCVLLCNSYNIKLDCIGFNVYDETAINYNGIVTKSNIDQSYMDLNPSFNFKIFLNYLGVQ